MKQKYSIQITTLIVIMIFIISICNCISQVTDYDKNVYKTIIIGKQEWMTENLNVSHYRNGDSIPEVQDPEKWAKLTTGAWCYYDNKTSYKIYYGKLYNGYAVNDPRGLAPEGWHIPNDAEWYQLIEYLGGEDIAGGKLKALSLWDSPNIDASNITGFTALPGGVRNYIGIYGEIGETGCYWTEFEYGSNTAWARFFLNIYSGVFRDKAEKLDGISVRCVKD